MKDQQVGVGVQQEGLNWMLPAQELAEQRGILPAILSPKPHASEKGIRPATAVIGGGNSCLTFAELVP